jgi:D-alanyl-D-alanine carboxypeptidase/D-alanyl-D-alanine-endopeptidase (penicillin-binding protein 4)
MTAEPQSNRRMRPLRALVRAVLALLMLPLGEPAIAALPSEVARAFAEQHIPLAAVSVYVQEIGKAQPLFSHQPGKPMSPASTMKLVTTLAGLELLRPDYRWKTEAYADGSIDAGVLDGNLVLKGYGDPKITIEQFQQLVAELRSTGLSTIRGDLIVDRSYFAPAQYDPGAFDAEPLRPYNVGPDALLVNFKSVRLVFAPNAVGDGADVRAEPALTNLALHGAPLLIDADCADWKAGLVAAFDARDDSADVTFGGEYPWRCGERDWFVALLDPPHYVLGAFTRMWADAGGTFKGTVREGRAPPGAQPIAVLQSPPLYDAVRDINKLSNNVMARQLFLTLATTFRPPPATPSNAARAIERWLARHKLHFPELVLDNGSGLSRRARISARSMARLLLAADRSDVRDEYVSSLAVAATDGTVRRRFLTDEVADQAFLKTGTLEGVRAIAGYVFAPGGRQFVVVCFVNHRNAARAQPPLDLLVQWVYDQGRPPAASH